MITATARPKLSGLFLNIPVPFLPSENGKLEVVDKKGFDELAYWYLQEAGLNFKNATL